MKTKESGLSKIYRKKNICVQFPKIFIKRKKYKSKVRLYESKGRGLSKIYQNLSRAKEPCFYIRELLNISDCISFYRIKTEI